MQFEDDHDMDYMSPEDVYSSVQSSLRLNKEKKDLIEIKFRENMSDLGDSVISYFR